MGIRFSCHQCGHELHVKDFQAGKRGKCPACEVRFRIPQSDTAFSIPLPENQNQVADPSVASELKQTPARDSVATVGAIESTGKKKSSPPVLQTHKPNDLVSKAHAEKPQNRTTNPGQPVLDAKSGVQLEQAAIETGNLSDSKASRAIVQSASTSNAPPSAPVSFSGNPQALAEAPEATWYVRPPAGGQFGPAPAEVFRDWLTENRVTRESLVWREGWPQWLIAGDVFADYFGPLAANVHTNVSASSVSTLPVSAKPVSAKPVMVTPPASPMPLAAGGSSTVSESLGERIRLTRKQKRRRRYMLIISLLAALAVLLVVALIVVLSRN